MAERHYLGEGVPLLKHVAGKAGQRICRLGDSVSVDRRPVAVARKRDRLGRPLPVWQGCRTLATGELLLLNPAVPDSLDGRWLRLVAGLSRDRPRNPDPHPRCPRRAADVARLEPWTPHLAAN